EVAQLHARSQLDLTRVGQGLPGEHLQQGTLAGAVLSHHAPTLSAPDQEVEAVVDDSLAVDLLHTAQLGDVVARALGLAELEIHDLAAARRLHFFDLVELL